MTQKELHMANQRNEGEGNRTADKEYVDRTKQFIQSGKVKPAADEAKRSINSGEAKELRKAEEEGKRPGHGEH
jgi:hypothetical protein